MRLRGPGYGRRAARRLRVAARLNLSVCVQHHPARAHLLPRLEGLGDYELVTDPEPDAVVKAPMRTYLHALRTTPSGASHRVVIQDDVVPGARFSARLRALVEDRPESVIALFVPGRSVLARRMREARDRGDAWMLFPNYNWCPTVALVWPVELAENFLGFADAAVETRRRRGLATIGDDPYVGAWRKKRKVDVWCSVPCLVEHPDDVDSLFRPPRNSKPPKAGLNRARCAALFVG